MGQHLWLIAGWDPGHKKDGGDILADLWRLDLDTWAWKQITPQVHASKLSQDTSPCCNNVLGGHVRSLVVLADVTVPHVEMSQLLPLQSNLRLQDCPDVGPYITGAHLVS